jgi:hypothetical protein
MTMTPSLTPCRSCNHEISVDAAACPSCGAPNKWIHPKIESFLKIKDQTGVVQPFTFEYEKLKISGKTEKKLPRWILWISISLFLCALIPIALLGTVGLAFGPIAIVPVFIIALIFRFILNAFFAKNKTFVMDFQNNTWTSNDDQFWHPVKAIFVGES